MLGFECVWVDEGTIVLWMFGWKKGRKKEEKKTLLGRMGDVRELIIKDLAFGFEVL